MCHPRPQLDLSYNLILRMEGLLALSQLRELHLQGFHDLCARFFVCVGVGV